MLVDSFTNQRKASYPGKLPLVVTFNQMLPNNKNVFDKPWHILSIHEKLKNAFDKKLFIAYRRNNYTKQLEATAL